MAYRIGVDIGGTFTDIVMLSSDGNLYSQKILSTPDDYSRAIEEGLAILLDRTGVEPGQVTEFTHATTVATNTIIERNGVQVALLTTEGFRDVLELGRFRSPRLYDLRFRKPDPLVPRHLRFEIRERMGADGKVIRPVCYDGLDELVARIEEQHIEAVAICFLNAFANPAHENEVRNRLEERLPNLSISTSSQFLPQINEFERTSTTVINAYVRPILEAYVTALSRRLVGLGINAPLMIMQSSGGVLPGAFAGKNPAYIIESGPAAGVVGAQRVGERIGEPNCIAFDMGGTTAKASLIENHRFELSPETEVGGSATLGHRLIQGAGYVVQVPTIDIAEVGAGGGSLVSVDGAGGIRVGPRSAGSVPGPACYDRGGDQATVTDANLYLGYLNPNALVGGELRLNFEKARAAIEEIAAAGAISPVEAAYGIHLIANASMMRALNGVSSERGRDPSLFSMVAIGGNGAVHATSLSEAMRMKRIIVPPVAGTFSALGLLFADVEHQAISAFYRRLCDTSRQDFTAAVEPLLAEVGERFDADGVPPENQTKSVFCELRYVGQTSTLSLPLDRFPPTEESFSRLRRDYNEAHEKAFGYQSEEPLQIVSLKAVGRMTSDRPRVPGHLALVRERRPPSASRRAYFGEPHGWLETPILGRSELSPNPLPGPAIIEEYDTTVVVRPGWAVHRDNWHNIVVNRVEP